MFTDRKGRSCFQRSVSVLLFTISLMATGSLLILVMLRSVCILLECFLFTARKRSLGQGNIFAPVCYSVHRGGTWSRGGAWSGAREGVPGPGGSPGPQPRGKLRGIWSRPTTKGKLRGIWSRPITKGKLRGIWSTPTTKGEVEGCPRPQPRGKWSRPTPKGEVEGELARPPPTATDAGGTHPTGMHSCYTSHLQ